MDSNRLNQWLTPLANIGVLLGLAVLIFEIRQNNELTMAQIEQSRSESNLEYLREGATNDHLPVLRAKIDALIDEYSDTPYHEMGVAEQQRLATYVLEQLDPIERQRALSMLGATYWDYENLYFQYRRGLVSEEYWNERIVPALRINAPRFKAAFGGDLPRGRQQFNDEIERILNAAE